MVTSPSASEIVTLLMIVLLFPLGLPSALRIRAGARPWLILGFVLIGVAAILAVLEHPVGGTFTSDVKNVVYALASIAFAVGMWQAVAEGRLS